jgi:hypothetical protein
MRQVRGERVSAGEGGQHLPSHLTSWIQRAYRPHTMNGGGMDSHGPTLWTPDAGAWHASLRLLHASKDCVHKAHVYAITGVNKTVKSIPICTHTRAHP